MFSFILLEIYVFSFILKSNKRTEYLILEGYKVLRFWNNDIDKNIGGVYEKLKEAFEIGGNITPPQPSPSREGADFTAGKDI